MNRRSAARRFIEPRKKAAQAAPAAGLSFANKVSQLLAESGKISDLDVLLCRMLYEKARPGNGPSDTGLRLFLLMMAASLADGNVYFPGTADAMAHEYRAILLRCRADNKEPAPSEAGSSLLEECRRHAQEFIACLENGEYRSIAGEEKPDKPVCFSGSPRRFYFAKYYDAERRLAGRLAARFRTEPFTVAAAALRPVLNDIFERRPLADPWGHPIVFDDVQKAAIALATVNSTVLVTGGPGTGKTTVVAQVLRARLLSDASFDPAEDILITAPTGRAAARLSQSIAGAISSCAPTPAEQALGRVRAATVHAALGFDPESGQFRRTRESPLAARLVVVDEASMIDIRIFCRLCEALRDDAALLLLGDRNQLPSVEAGAVLGDIAGLFGVAFAGPDLGPVASLSPRTHRFLCNALQTTLPGGLILRHAHPLRDHVVSLVKNHRSDADVSRVALELNAARSKQAAVEKIFARQGMDVSGIARHESGVYRARENDIRICEEQWFGALYGDAYAAAVDELCLELEKALENASGVDSPVAVMRDAMCSSEAANALFAGIDESAILCVVREGPAGCVAANRAAADVLCRGKGDIFGGGFFSGCAAMATRNMRRLGLFNGDRGIVLSVSGKAYFAMAGQGANSSARDALILPVEAIPGLEPAFALTIHKSQGSEFSNVMLVLTPGDHALLSREIVYTAVSRARKRVVIVGDKETLRRGVEKEIVRRSGLYEAMIEESVKEKAT